MQLLNRAIRTCLAFLVMGSISAGCASEDNGAAHRFQDSALEFLDTIDSIQSAAAPTADPSLAIRSLNRYVTTLQSLSAKLDEQSGKLSGEFEEPAQEIATRADSTATAYAAYLSALTSNDAEALTAAAEQIGTETDAFNAATEQWNEVADQ